ncbi:MAG: hypothetical protein ACLU4J_16170 [Butyricimonas paravirosa]
MRRSRRSAMRLSWGWKCVRGYHRHGRDDGRSRGLGADGTGVGREIYPDERAEPDSVPRWKGAATADEEVLTTAVFRFIHPDAFLRFAGGRALIAHIEEDAIRAGINSAIVGDLLTTIGSKVIEDMEKVKRLGFTTEDNL